MIWVWWNSLIILLPLLFLIILYITYINYKDSLIIILILDIIIYALIASFLSIIPVKTIKEETTYINKIKTKHNVIYEFDDGTCKIFNDLNMYNADTVYIQKIIFYNTFGYKTTKFNMYLNKEDFK